MFSKTFFAVAFAAVASVASAASPPGCLLGAVNTYTTPSDIKSVCSAKDLTTQIVKKCGDNAQDALDALADICNDAGVTVSTKLPTSASGTASATGTGVSSKSSGSAESTGSATPSSSGSASGTTSTDNAVNTGAAGTLDMSAAALLAGLGIFVAAL